ncbi:hypothetical protein BBO99_00009229 [Phytophthora kernoviae]|uniref:ACB domain-containing protein n=1 Tax=Phytophthora kernoviae TaxID=325452 RepID=A0A421F9P4_9STRA|nr:hypothetical protein JM16_006629 [Phytophthora kernoviae]RLN32031.1 hypothetical protein BBI17_006931 [Phytophthora kernoviae]RLN73819.1 hypothetical protein BBO99_00009229 [Phytophthora kernoviae]
MFFCSGPPRSYALSDSQERLEDVAVAMHPSNHVFARVSSSRVTLWGAHRSLPGTGQRQLGQCRQPDDDEDEGEKNKDKFQVKAKFLEDYPLNQGDNQSDYEDVAASMSAVPGSKYLFVGMASGMISVVEVAESSESDNQASWFSNSEQSTKIWKIDVRAHLAVTDEEEAPPTCYDLTCASTDLPSKISSLYLVASFEGGKCFIMLLSPARKSIDQLLSLVNTERDTTSAVSNGRCTTTSLDASGSRLALGWADGGVSLFRLSMKNTEQTGKAKNDAESNKDTKTQTALALEPVRELSLASWGYTPEDIGSVTALAWSHDARSVVVGYALRGFSLFATDGCRLMSSLPQHNQERPDKIDEHTAKEMCAFGVMALLWTKESNSLIVVPRGEQSIQLVSLPEDEILKELEDENEVELTKAEDLFDMIDANVQKKEDGLCLSLSGAPGRCGAWVRSDNSFTRTRDGGAGPAEACGQIQGGDLLVGINDNSRVVNLSFEQIVGVIKELPDNEDVPLSFMRLNWEQVFPLAVEVLSSSEFMDAHGIHFLDDETLCIREYALRMQALHGDCDLEDRPPLMEFERRAKFDGWEAIQGTSSRVAKHKYVKLLFALFPVWNPNHFLNVVTEYGNALLAQKVYLTKQKKLKELHAHRDEKHQSLHLQAYPRNHLDEESILEQLVFAREGENASRSRETTAPSGRDDGDDCFYIMESDNAQKNLFCVSRSELWCFGLSVGGSIKQNDIRMKIELKRQVNLPSRVTESEHVGTCRRNSILDFAVLPRFLHVQDEKLREQQQRKYQAEREHEHDDEGWLSSFVNMLVGGEVPDQYTPEEVLPRFAFLDSAGDVIIWDPENRSQRLLCSNVTTMARLFVTPKACASWPAPCRLIYGLYGPEGMKVWLPLLDGVHMGHTKAFEEDTRRLETFLACHDPLRAKTYEIEFGTAPATAELYEQVISEYGVALESFLSNGTGVGVGTGRMPLREGCPNMRGCVASVDDPSAKDSMLRFDFDVKVLGAEQTFGLLVGVSQDVYVPSGVLLPCYDVFARVQPIFHTLLCFLVQNEQLSWARFVLEGVRKQFALSTPTQELFLHSMLEACFAKKCPEDKFLAAIQLLRPNDGEEGDIAEYCEIVAHVARKSEPSRLKVLFPAAGDPLDLLVICQQRSELRTAANFLLILEECSTASGSSLPLRMESAAELLGQCVDQEEWVLAQHVVRVAREWEHPPFDDSSYSRPISAGTSIDERLATLVWDNLTRGEYERVVWCVEDLQAKLPHQPEDKSQPEEDDAVILDRLHQIFIQGSKRRQLRTLLQAVTEAHYEDWIARIKHVMEK